MKKWTEIPFKHKALFGAVLTGVLVSTCATHEPKAPADASVESSCDGSCPLPTPAPKAEVQTLSQENWSFILTGSGWVDKDIPIPEIKVAKLNDSMKMAVIFVKEEIGDATYQQYVVATIRAFIDGGGKIDSIKQVKLADRKAVLVQFNRDSEVIWAWIAVADGFGYGMTCGGEISADAGSGPHDFCQTVADSLQIK
jgi:hypothetical protein